MQNIKITWQDYYEARNKMFSKIDEYQKTHDMAFDQIVTIPCGGMLVAAHTSKFLDRLPVHTINVSSYVDGKRGKIRLKGPAIEMNEEQQKRTLVVDEFCDSGKTLSWIREKYPLVTVVTVWVRYAKDIKGIVNIYGSEIGHDTFLDFPWEVDYVANGKIFEEQDEAIKSKLRI